jgi:hypothetical protein
LRIIWIEKSIGLKKLNNRFYWLMNLQPNENNIKNNLVNIYYGQQERISTIAIGLRQKERA